MTQLLVETLIVVIILLVLRHLPVSMRARLPENGLARGLSAVLAIGAGVIVTTLALAVSANPFDYTLSEYYAATSVPEGFGRNLVNVILVDFRALDTLGEITVLVVAALGAHVLVTTGAVGPLPHIDVRGSVILRTGTRLMITLLFVAALFLLWRGHNEPGGGFIGGLVAAGSFALYLSAFGSDAMRRLLRIDPRDLMGWGLAIAVASGLFALATHEAFMTGQWMTLYLGEGIAPLKLGTPLLFDIGVFMVVIGFTLTILLALEDAPPTPQARAPKPAAHDASVPLASAPVEAPDGPAVVADGPGHTI
jgi:multicomponent Na+:H+ antiporter subunit A